MLSIHNDKGFVINADKECKQQMQTEKEIFTRSPFIAFETKWSI